MIVNTGKLKLLDGQNAYLSSLTWRLFPADTTITSTTVLADLGAEAAWAGYAGQSASPWTSSTLVSGKAQSTNSSFPAFGNTSGSGQVFYVWALIDDGSSILIAATNIGSTTIPDGGTFVLAPAITDDQA